MATVAGYLHASDALPAALQAAGTAVAAGVTHAARGCRDVNPIIRGNLADIGDHLLGIVTDLRGILSILLEQLLHRNAAARTRLGRHLGWMLEDRIHVVVSRPLADAVAHDPEDPDCICGPTVEWADPDTGETYERTFIRHHALDGRD